MKLDLEQFSEKHPYMVVGGLIERFGEEITFEFSRYVYRPQSLFDERSVLTVNGLSLTASKALGLINNLHENEELALHSRVKIKGRTYHIPMIDFASKEWGEEKFQLLRNYLPKKVVKELFIFRSGRSFHGYSLSILKPKEWSEFLGRLLLMNIPEKEPVVDTRWIGHRLIGGYCSLRWSCNTLHYSEYPTKVDLLRGV